MRAVAIHPQRFAFDTPAILQVTHAAMRTEFHRYGLMPAALSNRARLIACVWVAGVLAGYFFVTVLGSGTVQRWLAR
jgi:hypothetical protein